MPRRPTKAEPSPPPPVVLPSEAVSPFETSLDVDLGDAGSQMVTAVFIPSGFPSLDAEPELRINMPAQALIAMGSERVTFAVDMPPAALARTGYDHVVVDYWPTGHQPADGAGGGYGVPLLSLSFLSKPMSWCDEHISECVELTDGAAGCNASAPAEDTRAFFELPSADYTPTGMAPLKTFGGLALPNIGNLLIPEADGAALTCGGVQPPVELAGKPPWAACLAQSLSVKDGAPHPDYGCRCGKWPAPTVSPVGLAYGGAIIGHGVMLSMAHVQGLVDGTASDPVPFPQARASDIAGLIADVVETSYDAALGHVSVSFVLREHEPVGGGAPAWAWVCLVIALVACAVTCFLQCQGPPKAAPAKEGSPASDGHQLL
eukprot:CAMPEP_0185186342 /NCGR_PEP_ID=MMETSP1140-20130426/3972_1 /TAXON_ID=298111 /ORGANISM="Pavlova sp., Strain CCMP459" /LENGTH=374 /DNA_ID=CAMNT_0027752627 /DNA_START=12 /DNA_END=1136 /DNA_ORIENTATION=-